MIALVLPEVITDQRKDAAADCRLQAVIGPDGEQQQAQENQVVEAQQPQIRHAAIVARGVKQ